MLEVQLSEYGRASCEPSPVARMMSAFSAGFRDGIDINLGVGYVSEATLPRDRLAQAAAEVVARPEQYRKPLNYGSPAGAGELLSAFRAFLLAEGIGGLAEADLADKRIIVGSCGGQSLLDGFAQVLPRGLIITADPMYYIYTNVLARRGFELLAIPEDDQGLRVDMLRQRLETMGEDIDRVRMLYVVTVNNPSCIVLSNRRRAELVGLAQELSHRCGRKIPLLLDRAYEDLVHDDTLEPIRSGFHDDRLGVVYELSTLSKIVAPGLRMGFLAGPDGPLMDAMVQRTSDAGFSAAPFTQAIAAWMLREGHVASQIRRVREDYGRRGRVVGEAIREQLGEFLDRVTGGRAGFYYYLTFRDVETASGSAVFRCLSRTTGDEAVDGPADNRHPRVAYIPGEYCVHPAGELTDAGRRQMRISYGYESTARVVEAIGWIRKAVEYARSLSAPGR
jgi:2-aminoadipate transaminase